MEHESNPPATRSEGVSACHDGKANCLAMKRGLKLQQVFASIAFASISVESIFDCWHRRRSRPFILSGWTYEVCVDGRFRTFALTRLSSCGPGISKLSCVKCRCWTLAAHP